MRRGKTSFSFVRPFGRSENGFPFRFKKQFSSYLADDVGSEDIEGIYRDAHAAIRADPTFKPTEKKKNWKAESLKYKTLKLTHEQRKEAIGARIHMFKSGASAAMDVDEDD
jgi:large subunit ribosomal protein L5e